MPLNKRNTYVFHRTLFAGQLTSISLLKRGDGQQAGTVRAITMHQCRRSIMYKTKEPIQGDMSAFHKVVYHLPRCELDRVGVAYINPLDRIVDEYGRYWQPESDTYIDVKLFENHVDVHCLRVDPQHEPRFLY